MRYCIVFVSLFDLAACSSTTVSELRETISETPGVIINGETLNQQELRDLIDADASDPIEDISTADDTPSLILQAGDLISAARAADLPNVSNSRFDAIPATGTASYRGGLAITVDSGSYTALGVADITANFTAKTLDAETSSFGIFRSGDIATLEAATGAIDLTNGLIGARRPNSVDFDIAGEVVSPTASISIDGTLEGSFKGSPQIKGIASDGGAGQVFLDGERTNAAVDFEVLPN